VALAERDFFPLFLDLALFLLVGIAGSNATPTCLGYAPMIGAAIFELDLALLDPGFLDFVTRPRPA
jgi:hypothetical protein